MNHSGVITWYSMLRVTITLLVIVLPSCTRQEEEPPRAVASSPRTSSPAFHVMAGRPTHDSIVLNVITDQDRAWHVSYGTDPDSLNVTLPAVRSVPRQPCEMILGPLKSSTRYYYEIDTVNPLADRDGSVRGTFHTRREKASSFLFTITSDSHLVPYRPLSPDTPFARIVQLIAEVPIDFHVTLGDEAMIHAPRHVIKNQRDADAVYLNFREHYAPLTLKAPFFYAIGNHEGEGWIHKSFGLCRRLAKLSTGSRRRYVPSPLPGTYHEGAGGTGNYFAWSWGDALFVVVEPFTSSTTNPQEPTSWTLGQEQLTWLEGVLKSSPARWKILFQHHLVGGSPFPHHYGPYGDYKNYGRGGGSFARVGEQGRIHALMKRSSGQIVFKGHDHVYAHEVIDGIHYTTCPRNGSVKGHKPLWTEKEGFETLYPDGFDSASGFLRVAVSSSSLMVDYVDESGSIRDRFKVTE